MDNYINRLKYMTYRELKKELVNNKDKRREMIIRNVMKDKAIRYTNMKKDKTYNQQKADTHNDKVPDNYQLEDVDDLVDDILNDIKRKDQYPKPKQKKRQKILRDKLNDGLAERLESELFINKLRKKRDKNRDFIPPFISTSSSNYAAFNQQ